MTADTEQTLRLHQLNPSLRASLVVTAVVLTAFMDAIASTGLSIGRLDMLGDTSATLDEFAMFDIVFIAARITGFLVAPLFVMALKPTACLRAGTVALLLASVAMTLSADMAWIRVCRLIQGFAGGTILVAGQSLLFFRFPYRHQPTIQAVFALGAVMAPATVTPALQGWLVDHLSWDWIFLSNLPTGIIALVLLSADGSQTFKREIRFPYFAVLLIGVAAAFLTYVLQQGSRFNWFDDSDILLFTAIGVLAASLVIVWETYFASDRTLLPASPLRNPDFRFALVVSLVAGFALSGSAYLIPAFALNVLNFTATDAGFLLLPSGAMLGCSLLLAGFVIEKTDFNPIALVPFGILFFTAAMWLLSGSTSESGAADLTFALRLRGFGLGLLFVALTLVALRRLPADALPFGVGLFNLGRQMGGLVGTAFLQTYLDHQTALNRTVLASHLTGGDAILEQRLGAATGQLTSRGIESGAAAKAALPALQRALDKQVAVISFNEAFLVLVLLFVIAAPCLIIAKKILGRPRHDRSAITR